MNIRDNGAFSACSDTSISKEPSSREKTDEVAFFLGMTVDCLSKDKSINSQTKTDLAKTLKEFNVSYNKAEVNSDNVNTIDTKTINELDSGEGWEKIIEEVQNGTISPNAFHPGSGKTLLLSACASGQVDLVKQLMSYGAEMTSTSFGFNCLHISVMSGHLDLVKFFVEEQSFDISACTNNKGQDALRIANITSYNAYSRDIAQYLSGVKASKSTAA